MQAGNDDLSLSSFILVIGCRNGVRGKGAEEARESVFWRPDDRFVSEKVSALSFIMIGEGVRCGGSVCSVNGL
jgi:hypothetical protein